MGCIRLQPRCYRTGGKGLTTYNIVSPGALVAGQPEDISVVLANFQAIATILNGGIDNANINAAAAIALSKLAGYPSDATKFARGDGSWASPPASAGGFIDLRNPRITSLAGNSFFTTLGLTDWDFGHWEFVKDVDGKVYGVARLGGTVTTINLLIAANATSGVTRLSIGHKAVADGDSLNPGSLTDITAQDITVPATAYLAKKVSFTITETLTNKDALIVEVFHEGAHANDTLAVNTLLLGAWLS